MKRAFQALGMAFVILPSLTGARARADLIQWSASGTADPAGGGRDVLALPNFPFSSAGIAMFPGQFDGNPVSGTNSGSVIITNLGTDINGSNPGAIYQFGGPSAQYRLSLLLRDQASGNSGTLTFRGYFGGQLSLQDPSMAFSLTNTFVGPTTQTLQLGHNLYTVTLGPVVLPRYFNPPDDDPEWGSGSISASISVKSSVNSTPEPSSLLLACLGLPSLGLTVWRRRKVVAGDVSKA
jgi:hypothetical protein